MPEEAIREATMDVEEGADIIMVKPALAYLDIICRLRDEVDLPVAAYNVSGEFSMIKAAEKMGWIDGQKVMMETLTSHQTGRGRFDPDLFCHGSCRPDQQMTMVDLNVAANAVPMNVCMNDGHPKDGCNP
jgi:hypothetical protein